MGQHVVKMVTVENTCDYCKQSHTVVEEAGTPRELPAGWEWIASTPDKDAFTFSLICGRCLIAVNELLASIKGKAAGGGS